MYASPYLRALGCYTCSSLVSRARRLWVEYMFTDVLARCSVPSGCCAKARAGPRWEELCGALLVTEVRKIVCLEGRSFFSCSLEEVWHIYFLTNVKRKARTEVWRGEQGTTSLLFGRGVADPSASAREARGHLCPKGSGISEPRFTRSTSHFHFPLDLHSHAWVFSVMHRRGGEDL